MTLALSALAKSARFALLALAPIPCLAQTPAAPSPTTTPVPPATVALNRGVIFLDPAHGGLDSGARISDSILEKDVDLALAFKLRSLLSARGFTVIMSRDSDAATESGNPAAPLTLDDRAGIADHVHAVACLLLHATAAGAGVHLYSSELDPTAGEPAVNPWLTAQAAWVTQSLRLEKQLGAALTRSSIPLVLSRASVRPVDSLTCPAIVVELAPDGSDSSTLTDDSYQQRVAEAIATALVFWKNQAQPPIRILPEPPPAKPTSTTGPATGAQP